MTYKELLAHLVQVQAEQPDMMDQDVQILMPDLELIPADVAFTVGTNQMFVCPIYTSE